MNLADAIPHDDLALARLTASKLAKVMHGLMSIGTASLGMPSPADFLAGRDKTPLGFIEVFRCVGLKAGHADQIPLLRDHVEQLADLVSRFHDHFLHLAAWRTLSDSDVRATAERLGETYSQFCEQLGRFCALLGMDGDFSVQAQQDRAGLDGFFQTAVAGHPT
jgi:hypothetical protein